MAEEDDDDDHVQPVVSSPEATYVAYTSSMETATFSQQRPTWDTSILIGAHAVAGQYDRIRPEFGGWRGRP